LTQIGLQNTILSKIEVPKDKTKIWEAYHKACCEIFPKSEPRFESSEILLERAEVIRKWMRLVIQQEPLEKD